MFALAPTGTEASQLANPIGERLDSGISLTLRKETLHQRNHILPSGISHANVATVEIGGSHSRTIVSPRCIGPIAPVTAKGGTLTPLGGNTHCSGSVAMRCLASN